MLDDVIVINVADVVMVTLTLTEMTMIMMDYHHHFHHNYLRRSIKCSCLHMPLQSYAVAR
jgi:hypothetical protein